MEASLTSLLFSVVVCETFLETSCALLDLYAKLKMIINDFEVRKFE